MTQKEFQDRVKMQVPAEEYAAIEVIYMNSDLEKDAFCKAWSKMNAKRIAVYRKAQKEKQDKDRFISILFTIKQMLRYCGYKEGFNASFEKHLTLKMRDILERAEIYTMELSHLDYKYHYKTVGTLIYEIEELINKQTA